MEQNVVSRPFRVLSWGGGTQSTALGEMSASGEVDSVDAILFADTEFERTETYQTVDFYSRRWRAMGVMVEIVQGRDICKLGADEHVHIPFRTASGAPLRRQCTREFKINPIKRRVRELAGFHATLPPHPPPGTVQSWIGYSWDEWHRMSDSRVKFIVHRYPLIEKKINRWDSIAYLERRGLPVPVRSACICCPFRSAGEWQEMKTGSPADFLAAVEFDERNRESTLAKTDSVESDELYIYKHAVPLAEADLAADARRERSGGVQSPLFVCSGGQCWT